MAETSVCAGVYAEYVDAPGDCMSATEAFGSTDFHRGCATLGDVDFLHFIRRESKSGALVGSAGGMGPAMEEAECESSLDDGAGDGEGDSADRQ